MALTPEVLAQADIERIAALNRQADIEDVAYLEIVYRGKFVRFDISTMQASCLTPVQLVERCFREAFEAVGLKTQPAESSAYASSVT